MNKYIFQAQPKKNVDGVIPPKIEVVLSMPQDTFEDFGILRTTLHAEFINRGYKVSDIIQWRQTPKVSKSLIRKLKKAIGCRSNAVFIPRYAHSYDHIRYHTVVIDDKAYRYMDFDGGQIIKFAPELSASQKMILGKSPSGCTRRVFFRSSFLKVKARYLVEIMLSALTVYMPLEAKPFRIFKLHSNMNCAYSSRNRNVPPIRGINRKVLFTFVIVA